jgi:hypothetical protein
MFENQFIQPDQILPENQDTDILEIAAEPYPDKRRIKVLFRLSSFNSPPNISIILSNENGDNLAAAKLVNIFNPENEITLHIPATMNRPGVYTVKLVLFSIKEEEKAGKDGPTIELKETNIKSSSCSFILQ